MEAIMRIATGQHIATCLLTLCAVAFLWSGCKKDESSTPPATDTPQIATQVVKTSQEATISHPSGSSIYVPRGAVPPSADSAEGEMLFTIETGTLEAFGVPRTMPTGWELASEVHSMGPEGFIFANPVTATIPLPANLDVAKYDFCMFDYDRTEGKWRSVGGKVNADKKSLSVDVVHLCVNVILAQVKSGKGAGAIRFSTINGWSFKICIDSYTLKYPEWDREFWATNRFAWINRRDASTTPADGYQNWLLPQGTFNLCIAVYEHLNDAMRTPIYKGYFTKTIVIDYPHYNWQSNPQGPDFEFSVDFGDLVPYTNQNALTSGEAPCMSSPTPSVGVGAINVRLEWQARADLDLWVIDPCGQKIYYGNRSDTCQGSVGKLDLDNRCSNLVVGKPENIFWKSNPPAGLYKIVVDYYGDCASAGPVFYTVRYMYKGNTYTKRGTIAENENVSVAEFTY
jgi:hypothetical protein